MKHTFMISNVQSTWIPVENAKLYDWVAFVIGIPQKFSKFGIATFLSFYWRWPFQRTVYLPLYSFLRYYPGTWYPGTWYQVSVDTVLVLHNRLYIVLVVPLLQSQTLNLIVINVVTIKFSVFVAFSPLIPVYESFASGCREMFEHK